MELSTHVAFGVVVGLIFFGKPDIALLVGLGALIPDLDREYWFMPWKWYRDEQYHRALFHNVFIIALAYVISPFISLGIFLHIFQDSFTTVRDRGVEPFYPFSRLVKRGWLSGDYKEEKHPLTEHVYYYQEDDKGLVNDADPDLREEGSRPVPWRRIYGFALNSRILDHWFLFGSITLIALWLFYAWPSNFVAFHSYLTGSLVWMIGYGAFAILYVSGELDRHDEEPSHPRLIPIKYPLVVIGLATLCYWIYLNGSEILVNLQVIYAHLSAYFVGCVAVLAAGILVLYLEKHTQKNAII